jgi:hypothetical protein
MHECLSLVHFSTFPRALAELPLLVLEEFVLVVLVPVVEVMWFVVLVVAEFVLVVLVPVVV